MESKITSYLFYMGLIAAVLAAILTTTVFRSSFEEQRLEELSGTARLLAKSYERLADKQEILQYADESLRLTLVDTEGRVLCDSDTDVAALENHAGRPEIAQALESGTGRSVRQSDTLSVNVYYYALRLDDGRVLRLGVERDNLFHLFGQAYSYSVLGMGALLILAVVFAVVLTKKLLRPIKRLTEDLDGLSPSLGEEYKELTPFIQEIQSQRLRIKSQMRTIEEEKNKLSAILRDMAEGLVLFDADRQVLLVNESARRLLGARDGESAALTPEEQDTPPIGCGTVLEECVRAAAEGESRSQTVRLGERWVRILASPVDKNGQRDGVVCLLLDVTEPVRAERMKREFTANVSHELKTPLTSISGYAEMLENGMARSEDIKTFASTIRREAGRLLVLIQDIIKLSELDEGGDGAVPREIVDLYDLAAECVSRLRLLADQYGVSLTLRGEYQPVAGSAAMLSELVYNLCDNAIRYNRPGGSVAVTVGPSCLEVTDTGIGIAHEHLDRVCERFYRVDKSRSKRTGGTGLGLAIVKHVAELHHARLELDSQENIGTTVRVWFPPMCDAAEEPPAPTDQ